MPLLQAATLTLICLGGGSANVPESASVTGDINVWITTTRAQGYDDQVDMEISGDEGRIRLPRAILPILRGGDGGWFEMRDLEMGRDAITARAAVNFVNRPRIRIDRRTGVITIRGMNGSYTGRCEAIDTEAERLF